MRSIDIQKTEDYVESVARRLAESVEQRDSDKPFHIFLSGGSTPKAVYARLATLGLDWTGVHLWWGDERFVPHDHPDSNCRMVREQLLSKINIPANQVHPWPILSTPALSAETYEREFQEHFDQNEIQIQLLGMGDDGHTASLFPGTKALEESERYCVANHVEGKDCVRLTLTYPALAKSERVVFLVKGEGKASALQEVLEQSKHPASKVFGTQSTEMWLDESAASRLDLKKL